MSDTPLTPLSEEQPFGNEGDVYRCLKCATVWISRGNGWATRCYLGDGCCPNIREMELIGGSPLAPEKPSSQADAVREAREALEQLVGVIDAAGLNNLADGVQLGRTVWYVKASDALDRARAALTPSPARDNQLPKGGE